MPESTIHRTATDPAESVTQVRSLSYSGAVNAALESALGTDHRVLVFGEDVGAPGGVFGVTKGLKKTFGDRVFDTPISESAILGGAIGAAMFGRRPIVEIMWADFALVALDQVVNQAANVRYISRGEVTAPITIRTQQGSAPGACAQHSQSLEVMFAHVPGLQVCMPATAQDAHDLLLVAIACDDPTIVIENRTLYHGAREPVLLGAQLPALGAPALRRSGSTVTVVTWGAIQFEVLAAAEVLAAQGIELEVFDLRWMRNFDLSDVLASIRRTRRLVVVHEAHTFAGLGAEIVALVAESGISLSAAPLRIGALPSRIPAAPSLLSEVMPSAASIAHQIFSTI